MMHEDKAATVEAYGVVNLESRGPFDAGDPVVAVSLRHYDRLRAVAEAAEDMSEMLDWAEKHGGRCSGRLHCSPDTPRTPRRTERDAMSRKNLTPRERAYLAVQSILADLMDRRGLSDVWDSMDNDVKAETLAEWTRIVERTFSEGKGTS